MAPDNFTAAHYVNGQASNGVQFTRPICKVSARLPRDSCFAIPGVLRDFGSANLFPRTGPSSLRQACGWHAMADNIPLCSTRSVSSLSEGTPTAQIALHAH